MLFGLLNLSFWGYVIATVILTQITIAGVTIYLHRCQSHRALSLHPTVSHFFRFWLWLTTGMVTAEWVAIHRKHHATTDIEGDPHSPVVEGVKKVLLHGAELYRESAKDREMIKKYSHGTPDDWIENNLYKKHSGKGIIMMFIINLLLFGLPGISIWAIQMMWIPLHAAGIINGIGHYFGYRNHECADASTNIIPWGFWIGGEELHNNHHSFASSAKFSVKWWEFDLGWMYIRCLSFLGLATVRKLPPKLSVNKNKASIDLSTVKAVISNRLYIMSSYYRTVIKPVIKQEKQKALTECKTNQKLFHRAGFLFKRADRLLSISAKEKLNRILKNREQLKTVYHFKKSLQNIWIKTASSQKELVEALQNWCQEAEKSGIEVLNQFAGRIKSYV